LNFNTILSMLVNGTAFGMVYALMAMGIIMLVRAIGVLNFAQGDFFMAGAYVALGLLVDMKLPLPIMIPVALLTYALIALIFMFFVYWPLRNASYPAAIIIATIGTSIVVKEIVQIIWGSLPRPMPPLLPNPKTGGGMLLTIGTAKLQWQMIITMLVGAVAIVLVFILFEKLYAGRMMEAAAQDKYVAELLGIPTILTVAATYIISITLASIGGFLMAPILTVNVTLGTLQLRAFAGVIIGGMGNIKGAIIGSIFVGILESFSSVWFGAYKDAVVFMVLLIFLIFRPQGLFGTKIKDKA
jgi:branched-chain amino acid transport system permease protein